MIVERRLIMRLVNTLPPTAMSALTRLSIVNFGLVEPEFSTYYSRYGADLQSHDQFPYDNLQPLKHVFPSLKHLEIRLSRPETGVIHHHDFSEIVLTRESFMQQESLQWICRNRGLESFTLAYAKGMFCNWCMPEQRLLDALTETEAAIQDEVCTVGP